MGPIVGTVVTGAIVTGIVSVVIRGPRSLPEDMTGPVGIYLHGVGGEFCQNVSCNPIAHFTQQIENSKVALLRTSRIVAGYAHCKCLGRTDIFRE